MEMFYMHHFLFTLCIFNLVLKANNGTGDGAIKQEMAQPVKV